MIFAVSKLSTSEQSSSSKTASMAPANKEECATEVLPEKEKVAVPETPEEKKKRRQEKKDKKEEKKEAKKQKKEKKEKEKKESKEKTKGSDASHATESSSSGPHEDRRSVPVLAVGKNAKFALLLCEEYRHLQQQQTTTPAMTATALSESIALNGMLIHNPASTNGSTMRDSTVSVGGAEYKDDSSILTEEMVGMSLEEQTVLLNKVKTQSIELTAADETIFQLVDRNARMYELVVQSINTEEQLECMTEENKEFTTRVRALEQALILQEVELDNALKVIRQNDQEKRERDLLAVEQATNPFSTEEVDEHFLIRKELQRVRGEMELLKQERDMAIGKATKVSIQFAELKAETDESIDQLTENRAQVQEMREKYQQSSPISLRGASFKRALSQRGLPSSTGDLKRSFSWRKKKKDKKSSDDGKSMDAMEDNTGVVGGTEWMEPTGHDEKRRLDAAAMVMTV